MTTASYRSGRVLQLGAKAIIISRYVVSSFDDVRPRYSIVPQHDESSILARTSSTSSIAGTLFDYLLRRSPGNRHVPLYNQQTSATMHLQIAIWLTGLLTAALAVFTPQVHWSCAASSVTVFVRSSSPFAGLISTKNATASECRSFGDGSNVAVLTVALSSGHCGVRYSQELDLYTVSVEIHAHTVVIVDEDIVVNVTCKGNKTSTKTAPFRPVSGEFQLSILESGAVVKEVTWLNSYTLSIERTTSAATSSFRVGSCIAWSNDTVAVELTDSHGCTLLPTLLTDFKKVGDSSQANITSMFRLPSATVITFSCQVISCQRTCQQISCGDTHFTSRSRGSTAISAAQFATATVMLKEKPEGSSAVQAFELAYEQKEECDEHDESSVWLSLSIALSVWTALGCALELLLYIALRRLNRKADKNGSKTLSTPTIHEFNTPGGATHESGSYQDDKRSSVVSVVSTTRSHHRISVVVDYSSPASNTSSEAAADFTRNLFYCADRNSATSFTQLRNLTIVRSAGDNQAVSYH